MYGIINQSIQELITKEYGEERWLKIVSNCQMDIVEFENHKVYDDTYTYLLANSAAQELQVSLDDVLMKFGEFWIIDISMKKYPMLMTAGGMNFSEFMKNLPHFHNRIFLSYPQLIAPEFKINQDGKVFWVEYHSKREGLTKMMEGMLHGLAKMFNEVNYSITLEKDRSLTENHFDLFKIVLS
jgi:hypothetical protein